MCQKKDGRASFFWNENNPGHSVIRTIFYGIRTLRLAEIVPDIATIFPETRF